MTHHNTDAGNRQAFAANFTAAATGDWAQLQPLSEDTGVATPYPVWALGDTIGGAVEAISAASTIQPAIVAQACLGAANLSIQQFGNVNVEGIPPIPLSLFLLSIASSGDRKTTADYWALGRLRELEEAQLSLFEDENENFRQAQLEYRKGETPDASMPTAPTSPNFLYSDITYEGLAQDLKRNYAAAGLFTSEGGTFTGGHGMNNDNRVKTAASLSGLWDGTTVKISRKKEGGDAYLRGKRLCIHLALQPKLATELYGDETVKDQGFLSRFLPAFPPEREEAVYKRVNLQADSRLQTFHGRLAENYSHWVTPAASQKPGFNFATITLEPDAQGAWEVFHNETERRRKTEYDTIKDFANKAPTHLLRLAATLTLFENPFATKIELQHVRQAEALMHYYIQECIRLASPMKKPKAVEDAQKLLYWLKKKQLKYFNMTQLGQFGPSSIRTGKPRDAAIAMLVTHGYIRPEDNGWSVNPGVLVCEKNSGLLAAA